MKETCKNCPYQAIEYLSGGYGMPVREKPYCILEKEHKPCEGFGEGAGESSLSKPSVLKTPSTKALEEDIEDIPNDSYKPNNIGA